jgi:hypothetical protein
MMHHLLLKWRACTKIKLCVEMYPFPAKIGFKLLYERGERPINPMCGGSTQLGKKLSLADPKHEAAQPRFAGGCKQIPQRGR